MFIMCLKTDFQTYGVSAKLNLDTHIINEKYQTKQLIELDIRF